VKHVAHHGSERWRTLPEHSLSGGESLRQTVLRLELVLVPDPAQTHSSSCERSGEA
jgi:hypothetical protein